LVGTFYSAEVNDESIFSWKCRRSRSLGCQKN